MGRRPVGGLALGQRKAALQVTGSGEPYRVGHVIVGGVVDAGRRGPHRAAGIGCSQAVRAGEAVPGPCFSRCWAPAPQQGFCSPSASHTLTVHIKGTEKACSKSHCLLITQGTPADISSSPAPPAILACVGSRIYHRCRPPEILPP